MLLEPVKRNVAERTPATSIERDEDAFRTGCGQETGERDSLAGCILERKLRQRGADLRSVVVVCVELIEPCRW